MKTESGRLKSNKTRRLLLYAGGALLAVLLFLLLYLRGAFLPRWIVWNDRTLTADLNGDGLDDTLRLRGRRLTVRFAEDDPAAKPRIFRTPARYLISDVLTGDFTDDGKTDVLLLAWRIGNYGTSHPIWVSGRDITFTEHLFFYQYRKDTLRPLWMSSDVGTHIRAVVFDGEYLHLETAEGGEVLTRWAGWNAPPGVRPDWGLEIITDVPGQ